MSKKTKAGEALSKRPQAVGDKTDLSTDDFAFVCGEDFFPVPVDKLRPHPDIKGFYPIFDEVLDGISEGIRESGFDRKFPLQICPDGEDGYYVWDGLTRCAALTRFPEIKEVPAIISEFKSVDELFMAVIKTQGLRRKMNDAMLLKSVEKLQDIEAAKAKKRQGHRKDLEGTSPQDCGEVSMSANKAIALIVGKSEKTVEHAKAVLKNPEFRKAVLESEISLNQAYEKLSVMNKPAASDLEDAPQESPEEPAETLPSSEGTAALGVPEQSPDMEQPETKKCRDSFGKGNPAPKESVETVLIPLSLFRLFRDHFPKDKDAMGKLISEVRACSDPIMALLREIPEMAKELDSVVEAS